MDFGRFYLPNPRPEPASLPKPIDFYWFLLIFNKKSLFASRPLWSQPEFPRVLIVHSGPGQRCPYNCGTQNPQPVEENWKRKEIQKHPKSAIRKPSIPAIKKIHTRNRFLGVLSWAEPVRARRSRPEPARGAIGRIFSDFPDFPENIFPKKGFWEILLAKSSAWAGQPLKTYWNPMDFLDFPWFPMEI